MNFVENVYRVDINTSRVVKDLIEMGLDILDPIQPKAAGMDLSQLDACFGGRLTFHGGVDEQRLLPRGTPKEVRSEVERLARVCQKRGNYIVSAAHAIQADTPVENILAMYEAAREYQY